MRFSKKEYRGKSYSFQIDINKETNLKRINQLVKDIPRVLPPNCVSNYGNEATWDILSINEAMRRWLKSFGVELRIGELYLDYWNTGAYNSETHVDVNVNGRNILVATAVLCFFDDVYDDPIQCMKDLEEAKVPEQILTDHYYLQEILDSYWN